MKYLRRVVSLPLFFLKGGRGEVRFRFWGLRFGGLGFRVEELGV